MTMEKLFEMVQTLNNNSYSCSINADKNEILLIEDTFSDLPDELIDLLDMANSSYEVCSDEETGAFMNEYRFDNFVVYETVY